MFSKQLSSSEHARSRLPFLLQYDPKWVGLLGVVCICLGVVAMVAATTVTLASVVVFGLLLLIGGGLQIGQATYRREEPTFGLELVGGIVSAIVGIVVLIEPISTAIGLTFLMAGFFLLVGLLRLALAARANGKLRWWLATSGICSALLGIIILAFLFVVSEWLLGLFIGTELVIAGISLIAFATVRANSNAPSTS